MSDFETAARPYAKAIFELASEEGTLDYWSDVLQLAALIASDENMQLLVNSPSVADAERIDTFLSVMKSVEGAPEITAQAENAIKLLVENDRLLALPALHEEFELLKQQAQGSVEVQVTSARKLTMKQQKAMAAQLEKRLGKAVTITTDIDQSLIAGAIIKAGDLVIDGSALGRLQKLTSVLNK